MYQPLDPERNQIRLCVLQTGNWDDEIQVTLETVSLDHCPEYMALSYVWGDPSLTTHISVDGEITAITGNLQRLLRRIRNDFHSLQYLWVDALCINQLDESERSHQVALMGRIYKSTTECLLWLGEVDDEPIQPFQGYVGPCAADLTVLEHLIRDQSLLFAQGKHLYEMPCFEIKPDGDVEPRRDWAKAVYSLSNVLRRTWWQRIWTAQEAFLPSRAHICIGPYSMPFATFLDAAKAWHNHVWSHNTLCCVSIERLWMGGIYGDFKPTVDRLADISALCDNRANPSKGVAHSIYLLSINRLASRDHDYVYGTWGLAGEFFDLNWLPDYRRELAQVYASTSHALMKQARSLGLLAYARPQHMKDHLRTLPSWTPDWSRPGWNDYFDVANYGGFTADISSTYDGARRGTMTLELEGVHVCTITTVAPLINDMKSHPRMYVPVIREWLKLATEKGHSPNTVWEVIHNATHEEIGLGIIDAQAAWWKILKSCANNSRSIPEVELLAKSTRFSLCAASMSWLDKRAIFYARGVKFLDDCGPIAESKHEGSSDLWGSIGLALPAVQPEDQIYVVKGARAPIILRPIQDNISRAKALQDGMRVEELDKCYTFVGVSYMHGLMQGQAVSGDSQWNTIYIR